MDKNETPSPQQQKKSQPVNISLQERKKAFEAQIKHMNQKHPQCIPVAFIKHPSAPKSLKQPQIPIILFKREFKIEQALLNLYHQINKQDDKNIKKIYFFTPNMKSQKKKLVLLKPGPSIQQIFNQYSTGGVLNIFYSDQYLGLGAFNKMEKWMIRIIVLLVMIWVGIFLYPWLNNAFQQYFLSQNKSSTFQANVQINETLSNFLNSGL